MGISWGYFGVMLGLYRGHIGVILGEWKIQWKLLFGVWGLEFRFQVSGFRAQGLGFRVLKDPKDPNSLMQANFGRL